MKSLGEHLAVKYLIEPAGCTPEVVFYSDGKARVVASAFSGKANRIVFMRDDILMAWTFDEVQSGGGDLTVEFHIP
jgi:hypothetical protein